MTAATATSMHICKPFPGEKKKEKKRWLLSTMVHTAVPESCLFHDNTNARYFHPPLPDTAGPSQTQQQLLAVNHIKERI